MEGSWNRGFLLSSTEILQYFRNGYGHSNDCQLNMSPCFLGVKYPSMPRAQNLMPNRKGVDASVVPFFLLISEPMNVLPPLFYISVELLVIQKCVLFFVKVINFFTKAIKTVFSKCLRYVFKNTTRNGDL